MSEPQDPYIPEGGKVVQFGARSSAGEAQQYPHLAREFADHVLHLANGDHDATVQVLEQALRIARAQRVLAQQANDPDPVA